MSKFDVTIDQGEERMVATNTDMIARANLGATLAHDNTACGNQLPIETLNPQHLGIAISTVAGTTYTFLMCHSLFLFSAFSIHHPTA
jgi:hypothetical protein